MKNYFWILLLLPSMARAGTITTYFNPIGTITISSGVPSVAASSSSLVQKGNNANGSGTDCSCTLGIATTANNTLYLAMGFNDATFSTVSITDSCGDTFTEAPNSPVTGTGNRIRVYTAKTNGGCGTILCTANVSAASSIECAEYNNVPLTTPIDCDTGGSGNSTSLATTSPACTTAHASDTLIAFGYQPVSAATYTAGGAYTIQHQGGGTGHSAFYEDQHIGVTGTYTGSGTTNTTGQWTMHMMALKAAP